LDEQLLVKACLKGNRESQQQLYEQYAPKMLGVCYRYAHTREEAEDFLQEAFITVFRKLGQFRNEGSLEGWIRRIVINTSLNGIKARYPVTEPLEDLSPESFTDQVVAPQTGSEQDLISIVRTLPDGYRTVFNLYAVEGYSHEEIGKLLGIKATSSRSQYARARELLMKKLGADYPDNKKKGQHG
jgi:RNA polymerase sigma factor (sigma-70 family)